MRDQMGQVGTMLDKPTRAARERGQSCSDVVPEHLYRKQGNEADHRSYLQRNTPPVRHVQNVVVEFVRFVPEAGSVVAAVLHGAGNEQEMLEEFQCNVLVDVIMLRELERNPQQIERVHRHPRGTVRLADEAAGRQRLRTVEHADIVQSEKTTLEDV